MLPASFAAFANTARCRHRKLPVAARALCFLGIGLWAGLPLCAQDSGAAAEGPGRSPFLPQGWEQRAQAAAPAPGSGTGDAAPAQYVFNGMITVGSRTLYSISNTQTQQAVLVPMGENTQGVRISGYDAARNVVTLSGADGRSEELTLRKSDGEPLAATPQAGSRAAAGRNPDAADRFAAMRARGGQGGPSIERLEAYHRRLGEQLERRRAEEAAGGGGAVTVGGNNAAAGGAGNNANAAGNARRPSVNNGGGENGGQERQVRRRRLRLDMNQ